MSSPWSGGGGEYATQCVGRQEVQLISRIPWVHVIKPLKDEVPFIPRHHPQAMGTAADPLVTFHPPQRSSESHCSSPGTRRRSFPPRALFT